jgi:hypothetical protein
MRAIIWLTFALVVCASPVEAQLKAAPPPYASADLSFTSPATMIAVITTTIDMPEVTRVRNQWDADQDGQVDDKELASFRNQTLQNLGPLGVSFGTGAGRIFLDNTTPRSMTISEYEVHGAIGATNATNPIRVILTMSLMFPLGDAPAHHLRIEPANRTPAGQAAMRIYAATLSAPPGYIIAHTGGLPLGADVEPQRRVITFPTGITDSMGHIEVILRQAPDSANAPAPGAMLMAAMMLAGLAHSALGRTQRKL